MHGARQTSGDRPWRPGHATELLITYIYKLAFTQTRFDYAAAVTVVFFLLLLAVTWSANRLSGGNAGAVESDA